jgi:hypothetical protein
VRSSIRGTRLFAHSSPFGIILPLTLRLVLPLALPLSASASADAQTPVTGFVPPYEIVRTVRAAGFDPLAPPLREGTTYVLRATDFRGILMRVVVDAHTGAIRDANRIVPGPGLYGSGGYPPGSYGPGGYGPGGYNPPGYGPDGYGPRVYGPEGESRGYGPDTSRPPGTPPPSSGEASADAMPPSAETPPSRLGAPTAAAAEVGGLGEPPQQQSAPTPIGPPLPRPRPARLATRSVSNGKSVDSGLAGSRPARPDVATTAPVAPVKSPSTKPGKASGLPAIND